MCAIELVTDSVRSARQEFGQQPRTHPRLMLISCTTTGASRLRESRVGAASSGNHIFQGAENLVLGDIDIIAAGGNVERHRHEHIHVHIHISTGRGRRSLAGDRMRQSQANEREYATAAESWGRLTNVGSGSRAALHSTSGDVLVDDQKEPSRHRRLFLFFLSPQFPDMVRR
ncbi:hypothetical protein DFP72DRAFT_361556 [Ephemerocybe angulata]|uniref:Uncharacterized protein n=1 Tax=Ephemerocybe angulata TaxID=980116 RepID=A0A8H6HZH3_9AGAR|nr:hypothetical protein DFP72DRAFT_361556 [Tulosesus angulatus]